MPDGPFPSKDKQQNISQQTLTKYEKFRWLQFFSFFTTQLQPLTLNWSWLFMHKRRCYHNHGSSSSMLQWTKKQFVVEENEKDDQLREEMTLQVFQ